MQGWIKLHRKLLCSDIFQNEKLLKVFIYCLLKASHKERSQIVGLQTIDIMQGQFVFGRSKASNELNMKESTVWKYMKLLEKTNTISLNSNNKFTIVTVDKWLDYQTLDYEVEQQNNNKITTKEQQNNTNKNVKNDKNVNKKDYTPQIKNLLSRYSSETKDLITAYWNVVKQTRKSGEIQKSVIYKAMDEWSKFDEIVVKYALKVHVESHSDKSEKYTLGIMRSTTPSQANDRLDMKPYKKKEEPTGRYIPDFDEIDLTAGED